MRFSIPFLLILTFLLASEVTNGQKLIKQKDFSVSSNFLEPDGRDRMLPVGENGFVAYSKVNSKKRGASEYVLEKYTTTLNRKWQTELEAGQYEEYKTLYKKGDQVVLFAVIHNQKEKVSRLMAYGFSLSNGKKLFEKELIRKEINPWKDSFGKASVEESFANAVCSGLHNALIAPLSYQFYIEFSPDKSRILVYTYDYGRSELYVKLTLFDKNLEKRVEKNHKVGGNFINYGFYPNNKGEIYILHSDRLGRIIVVHYNLKTGENQFLDIKSASSRRGNLELEVVSDSVVYVGNINKKGGRMVGVMFSKFDFRENLIKNIHYHQLKKGFKEGYQVAYEAENSEKDDWKNYEMVRFHVTDDENILFALEKREIISKGTGYEYDQFGINKASKWKKREAQVNTESIFLFKFNKNKRLLWNQFIVKSQNISLTDGLNTISFALNIQDNIKIVYPTAHSVTGVLNRIHYVVIDQKSGDLVRDITLPNDDNVVPLRDYMMWPDRKKLIMVGKKGIFSKRTMIHLLEL